MKKIIKNFIEWLWLKFVATVEEKYVLFKFRIYGDENCTPECNFEKDLINPND